MNDWLPEIRAALRLAVQYRMSADAERHVRVALRLAETGTAKLKATCVRDDAPCSPECTITSLYGRCGRDAP